MGYGNSISNFKNKVKSVEAEAVHFQQSIPTAVWTQFTNFPTLTGDGAGDLFQRKNTSWFEVLEDCTVTLHFQGTIFSTFTGGYTLRARHRNASDVEIRQYLSEYGSGSLINRETLNVSFKMSKGDSLSFEVFQNKGSNHDFQSYVRMTALYRTDDIAGDITELDASKLVNDSQPINKVLVTDGNDGFTYQDLPAGAPSTPTVYFAEVASSVVKTSSVQRIPFNTINTNIGDLVQDTDPNYVIFNTAGVYKVTASIRSSKDESGTPVNNSNRGIQLRLYNQFTIPKTTYAGGNIEDRTTSDTSSIITNTFQAIFEVDATDKITVFHTETGNNNSQVLTDSYLTIEKL